MIKMNTIIFGSYYLSFYGFLIKYGAFKTVRLPLIIFAVKEYIFKLLMNETEIKSLF